MFYCPACGGAVATTNNSHYCVVCEWFDLRTTVALDEVAGMRYPAASQAFGFGALSTASPMSAISAA
jgi:hypothetical protein